VETLLDGQPSDFFLSDLQKLEQRAKKCIELRGECVAKIRSLFAVACFLPSRAKNLSATLVKTWRHISVHRTILRPILKTRYWYIQRVRTR